MKRTLTVIALVLLVTALLAPAAGATIITFQYDFEFSGAQSPQGATPWLTATLNDFDTPGSVLITMTGTNLVGGEKVGKWMFNIDSVPSEWVISYSSGVGCIAASISPDAFKADGDGWYDLYFEFPTSVSNPDALLGPGDSSAYWVEAAGLTANSFNAYSAPGGGAGVWLSAAHVQGIGAAAQGSGWVAPTDGGAPVPEPTTMLLLGAGLLGLRARRIWAK